jgi:hypothetical protein
MPHLRYCNRFWYIAGDELAVPALCSISARTAWTVLISIITAVTYNSLDECSRGWVLQVYLIMSIVLFFLSVIVDGLIINASLKGSIIESDKRRNIGHYLTMKFLLTVVEFVCSAFGIASIALGSASDCKADDYNYNLGRVFVAVVAFSQLVDAIVLLCCCYCFQASYKSKDDELGLDHIEVRDEQSVILQWETRCQTFTRYFHFLCCNLFGGGNIEEGFDQVSFFLLFSHFISCFFFKLDSYVSFLYFFSGCKSSHNIFPSRRFPRCRCLGCGGGFHSGESGATRSSAKNSNHFQETQSGIIDSRGKKPREYVRFPDIQIPIKRTVVNQSRIWFSTGRTED